MRFRMNSSIGNRREAGVERMRASWGDDDEFGGWAR